MSHFKKMLLALALSLGFAAQADAQANAGWVYAPMNEKGVVCREGGQTGLAIRKGPSGSRRFLIVMQGGGGCYSEETCQGNPKSFTPAQFAEESGSKLAAQLRSGVFFEGESNPFRAYHQVYIPYCSGDFHAGVPAAAEGDRPLFNGKRQLHDGWKNTGIYFDQIIELLRPELSQAGAEVMFLGQSAGGYGALFNLPRLRDKLRAISPSIKLTFVDESAPPFDTALTTSCFADGWKAQYGFERTFLKDYCPSCGTTSNWLPAWHEETLRRDPDVHQGFLATSADAVAFGFLKGGWPTCPTAPVVNTQRYAQGLYTIRTRMQRARVQYGASTSTYFITALIVNAFHLFTTYPYYYAISAQNSHGESVKLPDWLSGMVPRLPVSLDDVGPI